MIMKINEGYVVLTSGITAMIIAAYVSDVIGEAQRLDKMARKKHGRSDGTPAYCAQIVVGEKKELLRGLYHVIP